MFRSFSNFTKRLPMLMGGATLGSRYIVGDCFTQKVIEGTEMKDYSFRRTATFGLFGFIMGSGPLFWWFSAFLPTKFTSLPRFQAVTARSITDVCTLMPFFYFPIFYQVKELVFWDPSTPLEQIPARGFKKYKDGFISDFKSTLQVCFPMNMVLFSAVPDHLRVPAMSVLGFVWVLSLSTRRGKQQAAVIPEAEVLPIEKTESLPVETS
mmetsp:Transcript_19868/g.29717  ORF Transcript_19868/g.29717 Transcript_19868/m.29717 type:complete len:209 (+) Transcript_19868:70-696(+)